MNHHLHNHHLLFNTINTRGILYAIIKKRFKIFQHRGFKNIIIYEKKLTFLRLELRASRGVYLLLRMFFRTWNIFLLSVATHR